MKKYGIRTTQTLDFRLQALSFQSLKLQHFNNESKISEAN